MQLNDPRLNKANVLPKLFLGKNIGIVQNFTVSDRILEISAVLCDIAGGIIGDLAFDVELFDFVAYLLPRERNNLFLNFR
ncbi:hypothetical protein [Rathayibacter iranicus]|uniref:Uncharacterized protein n=2 Tax=Rathayibacter iranicus TaxID=59737 RepID=A0AAD1EMR7_9MICO|nr:hypothetical protein [Rathayibacter iranicus]AZZ56371.1 hypothetical protein C7V51_11125 [Rathayibacter iranicus]MWV32539.1 hypothetical protein [Rathayibacter iranicus NCPPB 2253 = VKM Ac-1602]PPI41056.1 hypothetical protein C5E09_14975 [Rathayibacter iranicus]PPI57199.1 hypothetical protein C5E08_15900 [Rathayibacter iranicus]PPI68093.1 hypothetical protein C5E01_14955 [Rathayibacter iranicus]